MSAEYEKIGAVIERVAQSLGLELVQWEIRGEGKRSMLRITIDKEDGVTHDDCVAVNNEAGTILDVEDLIPYNYTLEVSSPGLGKALNDRAAFQRHEGEIARIRVEEPVDGRTSIKGRIEKTTPDSVTLVDLKGQHYQINLSQILAANVVHAPGRGRERSEAGGDR